MIDNSYILSLYGGGFAPLGGSSLLATGGKKSQPTPPWDPKAVVPKPDALVRQALGGRRLIDEGAAQLDVAGASADYRKLFALYQGLETLNALANRASVKGLASSEQSLLAKRFASGLSEIGAWLGQAKLDGVRVVQGVAASTSKTSAAVPRDSAVSITAPIHEGSPDSVVSAFAGEVAFRISVARSDNVTLGVDIDLADMGSTPRTLDNVLSHINGRLKDAGIETTFGRQAVKAEPRVIQVGGKPVTLPAGADRWALVVRGVSTEKVSFSAPAADAVYVVQGAGAGSAHQLLKFQSDDNPAAPPAAARLGETHWIEGRASQTSLPEGVETVRASATGPDGSLWIVADISAGPANQPIKGQRDVALMKLDSAGRVVATRALGAASTASGYAIAVDADGRVAVAGSVTGALQPGPTFTGSLPAPSSASVSGEVATVADSFVTVFDAEGEEVWTQRRGARAADEATAVSFGADGRVIVAGRAQSAMPGGVAAGGWDGYIQTFSENQLHKYAPVVAAPEAVAQFGTAGADSVQAMTVDGSDIYTAGVEDGRAVLRRFTVSPDGQPVLQATRDLGEMSGEIAGLAVIDGRVILSGQTRNAALSAGTVTNAHAGGMDAFVATLSADLNAEPTDRLTYYGGAGDDTAADVKVHDGKVWLTGIADRDPTAKATDPARGYLARIDPLTGAVEWSRAWSGDGEQARPMTLAVAANGASVLDRLGLPNGEIDQTASKSLVSATSLRAGDRFYVSAGEGARPIAVTIEARDTLQTLARKIEQASNRRLKVTVSSDAAPTDGKSASMAGGLQRLSISARPDQPGAVITAGEPGRDALAGLGLAPGFIGPTGGEDVLKTFGLDLPNSLSLADPDAIKTAGARLQAALTAVRDAYRSLAPKPASSSVSGTVPAYLTAQLANYQAALQRLGG